MLSTLQPSLTDKYEMRSYRCRAFAIPIVEPPAAYDVDIRVGPRGRPVDPEVKDIDPGGVTRRYRLDIRPMVGRGRPWVFYGFRVLRAVPT